KLFFPIEIDGTRYGAKFLLVNPERFRNEDEQVQIDIQEAIKARATREYETMRDCTSPYLVAPGPIPIKTEKLGDDIILYFTEEFIEGNDLSELIEAGKCREIALGMQ